LDAARTHCIYCFLKVLKQIAPDADDLDSVLHFPRPGAAATRALIGIALVILPFLSHGSAQGGSAARMRSEP
jgi:hypothetical protein